MLAGTVRGVDGGGEHPYGGGGGNKGAYGQETERE